MKSKWSFNKVKSWTRGPRAPMVTWAFMHKFNSAPDTSLMVHKFVQFLACFVKYSDENIKTQIFTIFIMYGEILVKVIFVYLPIQISQFWLRAHCSLWLRWMDCLQDDYAYFKMEVNTPPLSHRKYKIIKVIKPKTTIVHYVIYIIVCSHSFINVVEDWPSDSTLRLWHQHTAASAPVPGRSRRPGG